MLAQNVIGLTFNIFFIADFIPWFHVEKFQSTEVRQVCLRLRVAGRSVGITFSHAVDAFFTMLIKSKRKIYLSDILVKC